MRYFVALSLLSACLISSIHPAVAETVSASESKGVSLTIYNQNFGLVKDIREAKLNQGSNFLRFEDVAAKIDPTSVSFLSLTSPNSVTVREQNYQYDLLDPNSILSKSIGKNVKFVQFLPSGTVHELSGTLLNAPLSTVARPDGHESTQYHGLVVKTATGVVLNPSGQVELAELPGGLISKPSLLWRLDCDKAGTHKSEIAYQTSGMNWKCDYIAVVDEDDTKTDLTSWVTLSNECGTSFKNAALKLIAGDVHRVQPRAFRVEAANTAGFAARAAAPQFQEQSFAEYHLYSLKDKTDVNNNETKQLSLFNAADVPTKKKFVFEPTQGTYVPHSGNLDRDKVHVKLEFDNNEENHLGMPWPKGKVRVYKRDKDGALQFIGEDEIDHTPRDEKVRLYLGDAFDVVGERKQTNVRQVSEHNRRESYEISLRNHKDSAVTVTDVEHTYGTWKIVSSSIPYVKKDSHTFEFAANLPPKGEQTITYEIELKY